MKSFFSSTMSEKEDLKKMFSSSLGSQFTSNRTTKTYKKEKIKEKDPEFSGINSFVTSKKNEINVEAEVEKIQNKTTHIEDFNVKIDEVPKDLSSVNSLENDLPITNEIQLKYHSKSVTALSIDRSGSRLLTGSQDSSIAFWDFQFMDQSFKEFRELTEQFGASGINDIKFNHSGNLFIAIPNSNMPKVFERDGACKGEFATGDPYLTDMSKTSGHTGPVTGLAWHPFQQNTFATCSQDSTVRIWDIEKFKQKQKYVIKAKNEKATKIGVTTCEYDKYGRYIAVGCFDGSIQMWNDNGPYHVPAILKRNAHEGDKEITSMKLSSDDHTLITRSMDDTLKIWDIRKFDQPVEVFKNLTNLFTQTDCIFSPDEKYIITGTSIRKGTGGAELIFIDKKTLKVSKKKNISNGSVIRIVWHPIINQIVVGSSDYNAHILYDKQLSKKGILTTLGKEKRKRGIEEEQIAPGEIFVPNALPIFQPKMDDKLMQYKIRKDAVKSKIPQKPDSQIGPGYRGQVGTSQTQYLLKQIGVTNKFNGTDAREAFLKHAKEAEENPQFVDNAYQKTQPVKYFDVSHLKDEVQEEDIEERFQKKKKTE
jgi:WD repeat-containing protein 70